MNDNNLIDPYEPPPPPMTPGQKKFLTILGGVIAVMLTIGALYLYSVGAFSDPPRSFDASWSYCETEDRCVAIEAPCNTWVTINENSLSPAKAYYDHTIAVIENSPTLECGNKPFAGSRPEAMCLAGLCVQKPETMRNKD
ncbi:MAG: hypothetical protein OEZ03_12485 [Alphaproteobacteria bacterium]|nr:hypothetical protein [Alphaproteobacteria bacterium]